MFVGPPSIITSSLLRRMTTIIHFQLQPLSLLSARPLQLLLLLVALFNICSCDQRTKCLDATCGKFTNISYPLGLAKSGCGHPDFQVYCRSNTPYLTINNVSYRVLSFSPTNMKIASDRVFTDCGLPEAPVDLTASPFNLVPSSDYHLTLLTGCPTVNPVNLTQVQNCNIWVLPQKVPLFPGICKTIVQIPILQNSSLIPSLIPEDIWQVLREGFEIEWNKSDEAFKNCTNCRSSGGICGYNSSDYRMPFLCYLPQSPGLAKNASQPQSPGSNASQPQIPDSAKNSSQPDSSHTQTVSKSPISALPHSKSRSKSYSGIVTGICVGFVLLIASVAVIVTRLRKRDLQSKQRLESTDFSYDYGKDMEAGALCKNDYSLPFFSYEELEQATGFFDEKRELGDGAFGSVYLGSLWDGRLVAVKRLYHDNSRRVEQFGNEVRILSSLNHPNLVLLIGYCQDRRELLLVYEYVPNGTLADHLHGESRGKSLIWEARLNIAVETAQALAYLHFCVKPPIFHRDVKSTNILLDENFRAKVADFGLSRLVPAEATHVSTAPQGTPGYLDPDYQQCYQLSDKSDVYSFGVVLVELISAKKAVDITREKREIGLANLALSKIQCGALHELVDPNLEIDCNPHVKAMVTGVAELAFRCLAYEKDDRPNMMEVAAQLQEIKQVEDGCPENQRSSTEFVH